MENTQDQVIIPMIDFKQLQNCNYERIIITQFSKDSLANAQKQSSNKIVLLDLSRSRDETVFGPILEFIRENCSGWRGLELNFTFQNRFIKPHYFHQLQQSISEMKNVESLCLTLGGVYVSRCWGENYASKYCNYPNYPTVGVGFGFTPEHISGLIQQFANIASLSPNLKRIWVDFQGISGNCESLLPHLTSLNQKLENCSQLQDYILSMNHCLIDDNQKHISQFLTSFSSLRNKKHLKKFVMNITDWDLSYSNYLQLSWLFSEILTHDKTSLEEFEFDHSNDQTISIFNDPEQLNEVQILVQGFKTFLSQNKNSLKKFYLSLCSYKCIDKEIYAVSELFEYLNKCQYLQRISLRLQQWRCIEPKTEATFFERMKYLTDLKHLRFVFIKSYLFQYESPYFDFMSSLFEQIGFRRILFERILSTQKAIEKTNLKNQFREEILRHMQQLCNINFQSEQQYHYFMLE